jgi:hypothetical protein
LPWTHSLDGSVTSYTLLQESFYRKSSACNPIMSQSKDTHTPSNTMNVVWFLTSPPFNPPESSTTL